MLTFPHMILTILDEPSRVPVTQHPFTKRPSACSGDLFGYAVPDAL